MDVPMRTFLIGQSTALPAIEGRKDDAVDGMVPVDGSQTMVAEIPISVDERSVGFATSDEVQLSDGAIVNQVSSSQEIIVR